MKLGDRLNPGPGTVRSDGMLHVERMAELVSAEAEFRPQQLLSLAERTREAKKVFEDSVHGLCEYQEVFKPTAEKMIADARLCRLAMASELNAIKAEYQEISKFLGSPNHKEMVSNLKELIVLTESFVRLSRHSALPALLDAALKVGEKKCEEPLTK
jgi:predicted nucleotidyltransferase